MPKQLKIKFKVLQRDYKGTIILMTYGVGLAKNLAFTPTENFDSSMTCNCGCSFWNATNFNNKIHFCPNNELDVLITDYKAVEK